MAGDVDDPDVVAVLDVEEDEALAVGDREECRVGVDAHRLVPAQPVHQQVQVDLVHQDSVVTEGKRVDKKVYVA